MTDDELIAELTRRGVLIQVGYCYPAAATDLNTTHLIKEHGYQYGPWQLIEMGEKLAEPPQWPLLAFVPEHFRRETSDV